MPANLPTSASLILAMKPTILSSIFGAAISLLILLIFTVLAPNAIVHRLGGVTRTEFEQLRDNAVKQSEQYFIELGPQTMT